jgi:hypothetical protein
VLSLSALIAVFSGFTCRTALSLSAFNSLAEAESCNP